MIGMMAIGEGDVPSKGSGFSLMETAEGFWIVEMNTPSNEQVVLSVRPISAKETEERVRVLMSSVTQFA